MNTSGNSAYQILGRRLLLLACYQGNSSRSLSCQRVHPYQWHRCCAAHRQHVAQTALLRAWAVFHLQCATTELASGCDEKNSKPYKNYIFHNPTLPPYSLRSCVAPLLPPARFPSLVSLLPPSLPPMGGQGRAIATARPAKCCIIWASSAASRLPCLLLSNRIIVTGGGSKRG